jgi:hypothetical protein
MRRRCPTEKEGSAAATAHRTMTMGPAAAWRPPDSEFVRTAGEAAGRDEAVGCGPGDKVAESLRRMVVVLGMKVVGWEGAGK